MVPWDTRAITWRWAAAHCAFFQSMILLDCRRRLQVLDNCVHTYMHRCVRGCIATPVTSLCTFVNMCVKVVAVATYACVFWPCVQTCLCVFKGARTITRIRTSAFMHMCVLCVHLCTPVHTCVVHAWAWALTGYNVLQCYKKTVTVQPCEYMLCCSCSNSCAVVTGVTAPCINMHVWHRVKHPAAPARIALSPCSSHALLL